MKLYLMRHGEALSKKIDPECGLSETGQLQIEKVATHLVNKNCSFKRILHSNKKRAKQTAEIMARIISPEVKLTLNEKITPNDEPHHIISEINGWNEDTLITSHLPFVPNLISLLTQQDVYLTSISFETATVVCLERKNDLNWAISWSTTPSEISTH